MAEESTSGNPYAVVLADLRFKRAQIDQAIAAIEALGGQNSVQNQDVSDRPPANQGGNVTAGMFHGMSIVEACKQLLALRKKPLGTQEITEAIIEGGVVFSTKTPANTVNSVLHRQAGKGGEIIRVGRSTWGLSVWYPNPGRFQKRKAEEKPENTPEDAPPPPPEAWGNV